MVEKQEGGSHFCGFEKESGSFEEVKGAEMKEKKDTILKNLYFGTL